MIGSGKMYDLLNKVLGDDWWELEIETIKDLIKRKYNNEFNDIENDMMLALRHICRSDRCYSDWYEFNQSCLSFSGSIADFLMFKKPSPGAVINGVKTIVYVGNKNEFSDEVRKYICICLIDDGISCPPPSIADITTSQMLELSSAKIEFNDVYKRIKMISNSNEVDVDDVEDPLYIQAQRIIIAEASALKYFNGD